MKLENVAEIFSARIHSDLQHDEVVSILQYLMDFCPYLYVKACIDKTALNHSWQQNEMEIDSNC